MSHVGCISFADILKYVFSTKEKKETQLLSNLLPEGKKQNFTLYLISIFCLKIVNQNIYAVWITARKINK